MKTKNLSKIKLQKLKNNISQIKNIIENSSNPKEILDKLEEIYIFIQSQHFGLNFETHKEEIEEILQKSTIQISEVKKMTINGDNLEHKIYEGENYAVLSYLLKFYQEKIDVICIDPPYNTGNKMLGYNDLDYIDGNDDYIHSKWLSFMEKRLKLAQELLSSHGVLFINIDETQIGCFILLCQELFGEENVVILIWPKTDPKFDANRLEKPVSNVKIIHEFVILCYKNKKETQFKKMLKRPNHSDFSIKEHYYRMESIIYEMGTTSSAKDEMTEIFGRRDFFSTPKPMKLIKEFIRVATNHNSIVLDFFAGSGSTGHAVIDLNHEDGGKRKFILVNNNENEICKKITYKRIKWVFNKYKCQDTLKYFIINCNE